MIMRNKIYYIIGSTVLVAIMVTTAIILTSRGSGSVIEISIPSGEKVFHRVSSIILGPGTSQKLYFHKAGWFMKKIEFRLPELSGTDFEIKALVTVKGKKPMEENWSSIGRKMFCLNQRNENLKDIVLTVNNNSTSLTFKDDFQVFAVKDGCDELSGTIKYEWTDLGTSESEQGVMQTTLTMKENSYGTEYVVKDGGYSYNSLGCLRSTQTKTYTKMGDGTLTENTIRVVPDNEGNFELKLPVVWGKTDKSTEYVKKNRTCIYGKEYGDKINALEEENISTLSEILAEKIILAPDTIMGNLKGSKEITKTLDSGISRKIKVSWDLARQ